MKIKIQKKDGQKQDKFNVHTFESSASEHRKLNTEVRETKGDQKKKHS